MSEIELINNRFNKLEENKLLNTMMCSSCGQEKLELLNADFIINEEGRVNKKYKRKCKSCGYEYESYGHTTIEVVIILFKSGLLEKINNKCYKYKKD